MLQLVLAGVQHQPVELNRIDDACPGRGHSGERALPGFIRGGFESLKQLEASFSEAAHDGLSGFDRGSRIPGRFGLVELGRRRQFFYGYFAERVAHGR
jgi:hypothetical protein